MPKEIAAAPPWATGTTVKPPKKVIPARPPWETAAPGPDKAEAIRELHLKAQERQVSQRQEAALFPPSDPREGVPAMENYVRFCEGKIKEFQKSGDQDGVAQWTKIRDDHQHMVEQMKQGEKPVHPDRQPGLLDKPATVERHLLGRRTDGTWFDDEGDLPRDDMPEGCGEARGDGNFCSLMKGHEGPHDAGGRHGTWEAVMTGQDLVPDPMTGQIEPELPVMQDAKGPAQVFALSGTPEAPQAAPPPPPQEQKILHPAVVDPSPAVAPFKQEAEALVKEFTALVITDQETLDKAADLRKRAKALKTKVEAVSRSWTDPLTQLVTRLRGIFKGPIDFLDNLVRQIDAGILDYHKKEEAKRQEAARQARQEQADAAAAAATKAAEDAQAMREALPGEQGEIVAQLIEQGGQKQAQTIASAPVYVPPAAKPTSGASIRKDWTWEVTDIKELCRAVADGRVPENYVTANSPILTAEIRGKDGKRQIPGLRIFQREGVVGR